MESIFKVMVAFFVSTVFLGLVWVVAVGVMALYALCWTHPGIGLPIVVFIWMCCVWAAHHSLRDS